MLINGRGQLGKELKKYKTDKVIYHTWNWQDKTEKTQRECYLKFKEFLKKEKGEVVFISTHSRKRNPYVKYKRKAEKLIKNGFYVRLPILIGKGAFEKFRDEDAKAFGIMEIITIEDAAKAVIKAKKNTTIRGVKVPAEIVKKLIRFGKYGVQN